MRALLRSFEFTDFGKPDMTAEPTTTPRPHADPNLIAKYRFWLAFVALILMPLFGVLAFGAFAMSVDIAGDPGHGQALFIVLGVLLSGLTVACPWLAYKLRPGGE